MKFNSINKPKPQQVCCEVCGNNKRTLKEISFGEDSSFACLDAVTCVIEADEIFELFK